MIKITRISSTSMNDLIILISAFFLSTMRGSIFWPFYIQTTIPVSLTWLDLLAWILLSLLILKDLRKNESWKIFIGYFRSEKILLAFLTFSFFSIFWSVSPITSFYKVSVLVFSTLTGAYIGYRYDLEKLLDILFWFGVVVVSLSIGLSLCLPELFVMEGWPYFGSWRGIYWHRNHLGSITAVLNMIFLSRLLVNIRNGKKSIYPDMIFYGLSLLLVYFAKSATGYILALGLNLALAVSFVWLSFASRLKPIHYRIVFGTVILGVVVVFSNLNLIFGLFGRQPSLTGRIPMWEFLIMNVIKHSPWVGYGFGAIWSIPSFRIGMQQTQGWPGQIINGDNGFIDFLLHLGTIGLLLFLGFWVKLWVRSILNCYKSRDLLHVFPVLFLFYTFLANITLSIFFEMESSIWMLMVALNFVLIKRGSSEYR